MKKTETEIGEVFEVGDIVQVVDLSRNPNSSLHPGDVGKVVAVEEEWNSPSERLIMVSWNKKVKRGHNCYGKAENDHGWNVRAFEITHVIFDNNDLPDSTSFL